jgi:hypothetical protein
MNTPTNPHWLPPYTPQKMTVSKKSQRPLANDSSNPHSEHAQRTTFRYAHVAFAIEIRRAAGLVDGRKLEARTGQTETVVTCGAAAVNDEHASDTCDYSFLWDKSKELTEQDGLKRGFRYSAIVRQRFKCRSSCPLFHVPAHACPLSRFISTSK